jgi:AraC family transcriptional regulator of adaptative response/methylated-DNA-[protein]-cysteine methyltransferase
MNMATVAHDDPNAGRWQAVLARDARREHEFVYAVQSTGIYCRASCPSRRPRREQVSFFNTPDAAEGAGYRACRRCEPKSGGGAAWAALACRAIENRLDAPLRLADLAAELGLSPSHLQRRFRRAVGVSPRQYAEARRVQRLKSELKRAPRVVDAVYEAGFGSGSRVYEGAAERLGMTPASYRRGGAGVEIAYTIVPAPVSGQMLIAVTARGLAAILLGEEATLESALREEYAAARIRRNDRGLKPWVARVRTLIAEGDAAERLPVDIQATAFQWKVWEELRRIPRGETRSYAEVARAVGRPTGARAVARACASNRLALVIPCHRVVGGDGRVSGYRWGVERKRALLERESRRVRRGSR